MARVRVTLNPPGMRELLNSAGVAREMHRRAESVLDVAKAAPDVSYDYERSLHIVDDHSDRARSQVVADVRYALAREARDRTLGRALDAAAGR